jgi:hypothetical protein
VGAVCRFEFELSHRANTPPMIAIATVMLMTTLKFIFHWLRRELQPRRSCLEIRAAIRWSYTIVVHLGVIDDSARRHTARAGAECSRVWPILEPAKKNQKPLSQIPQIQEDGEARRTSPGAWPPDSNCILRLSPSAPIFAPGPQRTAATRPWRRSRPAADPAGSPTVPCAGGSPCS